MSPVAQVFVTMEDPYVTSQLQELAELSATTETTLSSGPGSADVQQPAGDMVMLRTSRPLSAEQTPDELSLGAPPPPPTRAPSQSS